jgi:hypothetical protein
LSKPKQSSASDSQVKALLERYQCPTPFHAVRTLFLGNIATPVFEGSPLQTVKQLWGGELPEFENMAEVNELLDALVAGLWNRLTAHQSSRNPFRLVRFEVAPTREGLKHMALVRQQELEGFLDGLFGARENIDLPEDAHQAVSALGEVRAMMAGAVALLNDLSKPADAPGLKALIYNLQQMTLIAERDMNQVIHVCMRARRQTMEQIPLTKPTLH